MILNQQTVEAIDLDGIEASVAALRKALGLGGREFNVCFVDDERMAGLNASFRGKAYPTDVLSFPWQGGPASPGPPGGEFEGFLGDVVISVETARRNAEREGHPAATELRWLVLHGLLHLLGMDHETDHGAMAALELGLRARLGLDSPAPAPAERKARPSRKTRSGRARPRMRRS